MSLNTMVAYRFRYVGDITHLAALVAYVDGNCDVWKIQLTLDRLREACVNVDQYSE